MLSIQQYRLLLPLLFSSVLLGGCLGGGTREGNQPPEWVLNPPQKLGSLYGVGSAEVIASAQDLAQKQARIKAIAAITNQIEVTLSTQSSSRQSLSSGDSGENFSSQFERTIESRVPEITLTQLRKTQQYHDEKKGTLYLLLELDTVAEIRGLQQQIDRIDGELSIAELPKAANNNQLLSNIRQSARWLSMAKQRQQLQHQVNRLRPARSESPSPQWLERQQKLWRTEIGKLTVHLENTVGDSKSLTAKLSEGLTKQGVGVTTKKGAVLTLRSNVSFSGMEDRGVHYLYAQGSYQLIDGTGRVVTEHYAKSKGSSSDYGLATQRAVDKLAAEMVENLQLTLLK